MAEVFEPIFRALERSGTRYVVVGGVATVLQGHARLTGDLDLIVDLAPNPVRSLLAELQAIGLVPRLPVRTEDFADPQTRDLWIREKGMTVFTMIDPNDPLRAVDLFASHPVDFEDLWQRADRIELGGLRVPVASIPDLVWLKQLAGRPRDRDDVEKLLEIQRLRNGRTSS